MMDAALCGFSIGIAFCVSVLACGQGWVSSLERDRRIRLAKERARLSPLVRASHRVWDGERWVR